MEPTPGWGRAPYGLHSVDVVALLQGRPVGRARAGVLDQGELGVRDRVRPALLRGLQRRAEHVRRRLQRLRRRPL